MLLQEWYTLIVGNPDIAEKCRGGFCLQPHPRIILLSFCQACRLRLQRLPRSNTHLGELLDLAVPQFLQVIIKQTIFRIVGEINEVFIYISNYLMKYLFKQLLKLLSKLLTSIMINNYAIMYYNNNVIIIIVNSLKHLTHSNCSLILILIFWYISFYSLLKNILYMYLFTFIVHMPCEHYIWINGVRWEGSLFLIWLVRSWAVVTSCLTIKKLNKLKINSSSQIH